MSYTTSDAIERLDKDGSFFIRCLGVCLVMAIFGFTFCGIYATVSQTANESKTRSEAVDRGYAEWIQLDSGVKAFRWKEQK